jgi:hypothetical protein
MISKLIKLLYLAFQLFPGHSLHVLVLFSIIEDALQLSYLLRRRNEIGGEMTRSPNAIPDFKSGSLHVLQQKRTCLKEPGST